MLYFSFVTNFTKDKEDPMKEIKELTEFRSMLQNIPSSAIDEKKVKALFNKLKKQLQIDKELSILDSIYLQPFKLEYVKSSQGLKNYMLGLDEQKIEKAESYSKLVKKENEKLVVVKSFGKVSGITQEQFIKLLLLMRLSQYVSKTRELYSLEISMLQLV